MEESPETNPLPRTLEKLGRPFRRFYYGTTLGLVLRSLDPETRRIDMEKIRPGFKHSIYFGPVPGFFEIFCGPFLSGFQAASYYAYESQKQKPPSETDAGNEYLPIVVSGTIPKGVKTRSGIIGSIAETTELPVDKIYLLKPEGIFSKLQGRLVPPLYEKLTPGQFVERFMSDKKAEA